MTAAKKPLQKVPVSEAALIQRINRKLRADNEQLRVTRPGTRAEADLGRYYVLRFGRGGSEPSTNIIETHIDLEDHGRDLGALAEWEALTE